MNEAGNRGPGKGTTIVIADDEAPIRLVVGDKLRSAGFTVFEGRDGEEALDLVRLHLPSAVITDLQMPYMNGLELCTAMKSDPRTAGIPALLLTARGHVLSDEMLSRTNIRRVMSKPFGVRDLLAYVQDGLLRGDGAGAAPAGAAQAGPMQAATIQSGLARTSVTDMTQNRRSEAA